MRNSSSGRRLRSSVIATAIVLVPLVILCLVFRIAAFRSITDFQIENRWANTVCSIIWDQELATCSDFIADFVDLPSMRAFAARGSGSDWNDLQLHEVQITPESCTKLTVRHLLPAYGILTDPGLVTQTIWLTDGGVYTVATNGLARGDNATLCSWRIGRRYGKVIALAPTTAAQAHYVPAFAMPRTEHY